LEFSHLNPNIKSKRFINVLKKQLLPEFNIAL